MTRKYSDYLELNPGYESVVDEKTEERQKNFWKRYIVHDDMVNAVNKVCRALRRDDEEDKKSFWFHGTYGTGKTYSALVLRHMLEDDLPEVEDFFQNSKALNPVSNKFIGLRKRGKYLVVWKSGGCDAVNTASKLLLEMEHAIKLALAKHNYEYTGMNSLIQSIQDRIKDPSNNWDYIFNDDPTFSSFLSISYTSVGEFKAKVMAGDVSACQAAKEIITQKGWGLVADIDTFKAWVKDIIEGNNLEDTGLVFIWDEFTEYLKNSNDMNVLQDISEFCKVTPFYMMFIVHKHSGIATDLSEDRYEHMVARFHHQQFNINKETAYRLIGESIVIKNGMEGFWNNISDDLLDSIKGRIPDYTGLDNIGVDDIKNLFPIHPATVSLISEVAGNFAAAQRTLFRFLKDESESQEGVGFSYYINNNGPDDWKWLTPDQLWDYFFLRPSDMRSFGEEATNCLRHYNSQQGRLEGSPNALKIFKVTMLLLAVTGSREAVMKSGAAARRAKGIKPTVNTLIGCFYGQIPENQVRSYLKELENLDIILTRGDSVDSWLERPFNREGNSRTQLEKEIEKIKKLNTPYMLLSSGVFGAELKDQFIPEGKAISKRIEVETCWGDNSSILLRLPELLKRLQKYPYKFGVLLLVVGSDEQYFKVQDIAAGTAQEDTSARLIVAVLKKPLDDGTLQQWFENKALTQTAAGNNYGGSSSKFDTTAKAIVREWVTGAVASEMVAYYRDAQAPTIYNNSNFANVAEKYILSLFTAAPELIVKTVTAYKSGGEKAAFAGIEKQEGNQQVKNIVEALKNAQVWDIDNPNDYKFDSDKPAARSIAALYQFIESQFASNSGKIDLSDLWSKLQDPPFGYYDTLVCNFLIGFIMRHYKDSDYTWYDGSNPFMLKPENLSKMISKMCKNQSAGHYLSAISETERYFKEYTKRIFDMTADEVANPELARKNIKVKITKSGMPIWMIKYIPDDKMSGVKDNIYKIIDALIPFIRQDGDQKEIMEDINNKCKGKNSALKVISENYKNKSLLFQGFENYLMSVNPDILVSAKNNGFSMIEVFSALTSILPGEKYEWLESQVEEKLEILLCDINLIGCINSVMHNKRKTIDKIKDELANVFYHQKLPKSIYESCCGEYGHTVMQLYAISHNQWVEYSVEEKRKIIAHLQKGISEAWRFISHSEIVLEEYLAKNGFNHSHEEILRILDKLHESGFDQREESFKTDVLNIRKELEHQQLVERSNNLWEMHSGSKSVIDWCNKHGIPIQWVLSNNDDLINTLKACQEGSRRDISELKKCVSELESSEKFEVLKDTATLNDLFLDYISKGYSGILLGKVEDLKNYLRTELSPKVYTWPGRFNEIRSYTKEFIKTEMKTEVLGKAQSRLDNMSEKDIRQLMKSIMENDPDLCMYLLEDY